MINVYHLGRLLVSYQTDQNIAIDLSRYLTENYQLIRRKAVKVHSDANSYIFKLLKEKEQNYLALILQNGYEFSPFKDKDLYAICIKIALDEIEYVYKHYKKISYYNKFDDLFFENNSYVIKKIKFSFNFFISLIKLILLFVNFLLIIGRVNHGLKKSVRSYKFLFIEYFLNHEIKEVNGKNKYFSKQTCGFIDSVADECSTCRIQLNTKILPFYKMNKNIKSTLSSVHNIYSIFYFSTNKDILLDLYTSIKLYYSYRSILKNIPNDYKHVFNQRFQIHNFFVDYFTVKSLHRAVDEFDGQYIYCVSECQSWEFGLIYSLSLNNESCQKQLVFYVHAPVRTWDFRFHTLKSKLAEFKLGCKKIAVQYILICDSDLRYFHSMNLDNIRIGTRQAFRYLYLNNAKLSIKKYSNSSRNIVGIIFDYSEINANKLIDLLVKFCNKYGEEYLFVAKFHPANSESVINKANTFADKFEGDMLSLFERCNFVICSSSTSSSIDANYYGINCLTFLGLGLNLNSFDNLLNETFGDEEELYKLLSSPNGCSTNEHKYVRNALGLYL